jgi:hypothetical protein
MLKARGAAFLLTLLGSWGFAGLAMSQDRQKPPGPTEAEVRKQIALSARALDRYPNPLQLTTGEIVKTKEEWFGSRRPELFRLAQTYMYGFAPGRPEKVTAAELFRDGMALGGMATLREVELKFGVEQKASLRLLIATPNKAKGAVASFVAVNFCGNHAALKHDQISIPEQWIYESCTSDKSNKASPADRGRQAEVWCIEQLIDRGYALATFYGGDLDTDNNDMSDGLYQHFYKAGQTKPEQSDWGYIAACAWGLSRAADYLETQSEFDPKRIAVTGHSRHGKAALWAGATDERFAIVIPHQSGTGGMAMSRDNDQETVERINRVFPHWFCDNFVKFGGNEKELPIDQHCIVALCAPRPVLDTEGIQDTWANYDAAWRSLQGADPVYKLLGCKGLASKKPVEGDEPFSDQNFGELVQYRRDEKHVLNADYWKRILDFADLWYASRR